MAERKPNRVRCSRCDTLFEPELLRQVGMKRRLCETCVVDEATELSGAEPMRLPNRSEKLDALPDEPHPDWPGRRGRLSPSEIGTFLSCPEQWRMEKILGYRSPQGSRAVVGNAVHATAEAFWEVKLAGGPRPDDKTIQATALVAFDEAVHNEIGPPEEGGRGGVIDWREPHDLCREEAAHLASVYLETVGDSIFPVSTEATSVARVAGVPIPIVSIADLLRADYAGGPAVAIVDLKTGGKAHKEAGTYWTAQGLVQQLAQDLACEWHSVGFNGQVNWPENEPALRIERSAERYAIAAELVRTTYDTILLYYERFGPHRVWPGARTHPQTCGMCDHVASCSWWTADAWIKDDPFGLLL